MADPDLAMRRVMLLTLARLAGFAVVLAGFWLMGTANGPTLMKLPSSCKMTISAVKSARPARRRVFS